MRRPGAVLSFALLVLLAGCSKPRETQPRPPTPGARAPTVDLYGDPLPPGAIARLGTVRLRQGGRAKTVVFSPDGKTLASSDWHGRVGGIHLWNATTGRRLLHISAHSSLVECFAFSPDGKTIASGGGHGTIGLWNAETGERIWRRKRRRSVLSVAFSPNGRILALADGGRSIHFLDASTGEENTELGGHVGQKCLAFSPGGEKLASGGYDGSVRLWDVRTGRQTAELVGLKDGGDQV